MAVVLREVFIASNFDEFYTLREELRTRLDASRFARAVDLGQNAAHPASVTDHSLSRVRSSDVLVLLVGENYGRERPDGKFSYTHLEYREARAEGIPVIPYFIGPTYADEGHRRRSAVPEMRAFQKEIIGRHVVAFHDTPEDPAELADVIVARVREVLMESSVDSSEDAEDAKALDVAELPDDELEFLESSKSRRTDTLRNELDVLSHPAEAAAAEQVKEAKRAIEIGDRLAAIHHLRKSLDYRPLDVDAGYWLARLLVGSTHRKYCREASRLARRVARVADHEGNAVRKGLALALAARAELALDNEVRAMQLAGEAKDAAQWVAAIHIECAWVYARARKIGMAIEEAAIAFKRHPESFWKLAREPALARTPEFRAWKRDLLDQTRRQVDEVLRVELGAEILERTFGGEPVERAASLVLEVPSYSLVKAVLRGRESAARTQEALRRSSKHFPNWRATVESWRDEIQNLENQRDRIHAEPLRPLPGHLEWLSIALPTITAIALAVVSGGGGAQIFSMMVLGFIVGIGGRFALQKRRRSQRVARATDENREKLEHAHDKLMAAERALGSAGTMFADLVQRFETSVVAPGGGIFVRSAASSHAKVNDHVRLRSDEPAPSGCDLDMQLFPPGSGFPEPISRPTSDFRLLRLTRGKGNRFVAARWASYFAEDSAKALARMSNGSAAS